MLMRLECLCLGARDRFLHFVKELKEGEAGVAAIVATVLLILIVVLLASLFWDYISEWFEEMWDIITGANKIPSGT